MQPTNALPNLAPCPQWFFLWPIFLPWRIASWLI